MNKVQLAIQGGGAKFIHLFAAASAFKEMHDREEIVITRIAGTSAGSLVAALLVSGASADAVNAFIRERGPFYVEKIKPTKFPSRYKASVLNLMLSAIAGRPFFSEEVLRSFMKELFQRAKGFVPKTIAECEAITETKLMITTSNIRDSCGHTFHENDNLIDALIASCAVPFAFRTYKNSGYSNYVDGGICDNLPAEVLVKAESTFGKAFAISPRHEQESFPLHDPVRYVSALLSASINHSVTKNKQLIGTNRLISVDTDLKIFDFRKMLDQTDITSQYRSNKNLAMRTVVSHLQFNRFANAGSEMVDGDVADVRRLSATTYEVLKNLKGLCTVRVASHTTSVFANCLFPKADDRDAAPDIVRKQLRFQVVSGSMRMLELNLRTEGNVYHLKPTIWSVTNLVSGAKVKATLLPLFLENAGDVGQSKCIICFDESIQGRTDGDVYLCEWTYAVENCLIGIERAGSDFIAETNGCGCLIEEMNLVAYLPSKYSQGINVAVEQRDEYNQPNGRAGQTQDTLNLQAEIGYDAVGARIRDVAPRVRVEMRVQRTHMKRV